MLPTKGESFNSIHDYEREPTDGPRAVRTKPMALAMGLCAGHGAELVI